MKFIKTEYSFKQVFFPLQEAVDKAVSEGHESVCIIDDTTFGYIKFEKACKEAGIKPIFGLSLMITDCSVKSRSKYETCNDSEEVILIARNMDGVRFIYDMYKLSTERFNRFARILPEDLYDPDKKVLILANKYSCDITRSLIDTHVEKFPSEADRVIFQCITGSRGIPPRPFVTASMRERLGAVEECIEDFSLSISPMVKYNGTLDFETECRKGLKSLKLESDEYLERLSYEIDMIKSKDFQDYFMIVADMITTAKETMIVGPGRGSSGGSLVCYCLGITAIDPIAHGLIFERFIDIHRSDYPDIDTDYPDTRRADVIEDTKRKYKSVYKLSTVTRYSPKVILNDFAKEYKIPVYELDLVKNAIIERSSGDARAKACLGDTLEGEAGKKFLEERPQMGLASRAEGHARNSGTHAAGIIVLDEAMSNYGAVDFRAGVVCLEGADAESIGLLKIDCLGLRTLSVIENCLKLSNVPLASIYDIPLDDKDVLDVFNKDDLSDIFQFDGDAIGMVCRSLTVKQFDDLVAITALGRPGALNSGGTARYIKINEGEKEPEFFGDIYEKVTASTNSIVVYQEQTMVLLREFGNLSWEDVNIMRKIISKSRGDEFFAKYKVKFVAGAEENGYDEETANIVWEAIASMGSYAFNKSHAVAYAMISYWCAYCKTYYPFNFLAANLNNAKDEGHALKMLRKYVDLHGIDYVPVDPDVSAVGWTIQDGKLIGGLTNIAGIGEKKALDIIERRKPSSKKKLTKTMIKNLMNPITKFDELYPLQKRYAHIYDSNNITLIDDIEPGIPMVTIGTLITKDLRDRNDVQSVMKRGGEIVTENTHYLTLVIEDDTGTVKGVVAPFDMDDIGGLHLAETLKVGSVIAINGKVRKGWSTISIRGVSDVEGT